MINLGNIFILGDSYSTFKGCIPEGYDAWYSPEGRPETDVNAVEQTWWKQLLSQTKSDMLLNCSYSGTTVCNTGYDGEDCSYKSFIARLDKLVQIGYFRENQVDTFFIFGGTNDSWAEAPVGELKYAQWEKEELYSVLPAFCYLLHTAKANVAARIVCIINTNLKQPIADGFRTACEHYGIEWIALNDIDKMNGHPSIRGMEQIKQQILHYFEINER